MGSVLLGDICHNKKNLIFPHFYFYNMSKQVKGPTQIFEALGITYYSHIHIKKRKNCIVVDFLNWAETCEICQKIEKERDGVIRRRKKGLIDFSFLFSLLEIWDGGDNPETRKLSLFSYRIVRVFVWNLITCRIKILRKKKDKKGGDICQTVLGKQKRYQKWKQLASVLFRGKRKKKSKSGAESNKTNVLNIRRRCWRRWSK